MSGWMQRRKEKIRDTFSKQGPTGDPGTSGISLKLIHKAEQYDIAVPAFYSFGQLKVEAARLTGLRPEHFTLLFNGKARQDTEVLFGCGVKHGARIAISESEAFREERAHQNALQEQHAIEQAQENAAQRSMLTRIGKVRGEVDELEAQAAAAWNTAPSPQRSQKCKGFAELLTQKLLALDNIEVAGDARHVRKQLINRINDLCARLENTPSY